MELPIEVKNNMVNYTLVANRNSLHIRDTVTFEQLRDSSLRLYDLVKKGKGRSKEYVDEATNHAALALHAIFRNAGQPQILAEWGLQGFHPEGIKKMLDGEEQAKKNRIAALEQKKREEAAEIAHGKKLQEELKAEYSGEDNKPVGNKANSFMQKVLSPFTGGKDKSHE